MIDYSKTPQSARYAFTFWAFPRKDWVRNLQDYLVFADAHFTAHGFRCNMPLGSYFVRKDTSSLLSYTFDGDIMSLDPIHAPGERDSEAWARVPGRVQRLGTGARRAAAAQPEPVRHAASRSSPPTASAGRRSATGCRTVDPERRMVNPFFAALLVSP